MISVGLSLIPNFPNGDREIVDRQTEKETRHILKPAIHTMAGLKITLLSAE